jgi:hypothetical protein
MEVNLGIACACIATLKPLTNRFFPKLLGKLYGSNNNNSATHLPLSGKPSKLINEDTVLARERGLHGGSFGENGGGSCEMQLYSLRAKSGQHRATVKGKRDVDGSSSQESIIGAAESFPQDAEEK